MYTVHTQNAALSAQMERKAHHQNTIDCCVVRHARSIQNYINLERFGVNNKKVK